jgi:hypothetical protein
MHAWCDDTFPPETFIPSLFSQDFLQLHQRRRILMTSSTIRLVCFVRTELPSQLLPWHCRH